MNRTPENKSQHACKPTSQVLPYTPNFHSPPRPLRPREQASVQKEVCPRTQPASFHGQKKLYKSSLRSSARRRRSCSLVVALLLAAIQGGRVCFPCAYFFRCFWRLCSCSCSRVPPVQVLALVGQGILKVAHRSGFPVSAGRPAALSGQKASLEPLGRQ